jgi:polyisoprenoid-binding protein YceI
MTRAEAVNPGARAMVRGLVLISVARARAVVRDLALIIVVGGLAGCGHLLPRAETAPPSALPAGTYRLDPEHATLLVKIDHLGFSQLVGRFDRFDATLDFDPADPAAARLSVTIDPASLDFNLPEFEDTLRGADWFDVARFPEARFDSREVAVTGAETARVTGDLTLHGATRPVTLEVTFNGAGDSLVTGRYTLGFGASGTLLRSEFGLGGYAPAVGDEVVLEIHAEFQRVE